MEVVAAYESSASDEEEQELDGGQAPVNARQLVEAARRKRL
jgi:hypothetical protein